MMAKESVLYYSKRKKKEKKNSNIEEKSEWSEVFSQCQSMLVGQQRKISYGPQIRRPKNEWKRHVRSFEIFFNVSLHRVNW